jgi:hypothetical protein
MPDTTKGAEHEIARRLATASGLDLTDEHLADLASSLLGNADMARVLLAIEYGALEPASRFRAPRALR